MNEEIKTQLLSVLQEEDALLDQILQQQTLLHKNVVEKDWNSLNDNIMNLQVLSDGFVSLEEKRVAISEELNGDDEFNGVLGSVRSKLNKSKIENHVLNEYISTTRKFLQGVFDKVVPQKRNVVYSKNGTLTKPEVGSILFNQIV